MTQFLLVFALASISAHSTEAQLQLPQQKLRCTNFGNRTQSVNLSQDQGKVTVVNNIGKVISTQVTDKKRLSSQYGYKQEYTKQSENYKYNYVITGNANTGPYRCSKIYHDENLSQQMLIRSSLFAKNGEHLLSTKCLLDKKTGFLSALDESRMACITVTNDNCGNFQSILKPLNISSFSENQQITECNRRVDFKDLDLNFLREFSKINTYPNLYLFKNNNEKTIRYDEESASIQEMISHDLSKKDRKKYNLGTYKNNFLYPKDWKSKKVSMSNVCSLLVFAHNKCKILAPEGTQTTPGSANKQSR